MCWQPGTTSPHARYFAISILLRGPLARLPFGCPSARGVTGRGPPARTPAASARGADPVHEPRALSSSGGRVEPSPGEPMAATQSPERERAPADEPVPAEGQPRVLGARWPESAPPGEE